MKDFKAFLLRGNVVDLAVGIVIGAAFGAVVTAFVGAFMTPLIALLVGKNGIADLAFTVGGNGTPKDPGTQFPYGTFLTAIIAFVFIAAAVFFFVVRPVNRLMERRKTEPEAESPTRECPECLSSIPAAATRCAFCTAQSVPIEMH
jgi:large conductance mechanosensitive channel